MTTHKQPFTEPGHMNSSYFVLFHLAILFVAPLITSSFPAELRSDAIMVSIVFPVTLFWFGYLLKQFLDTTALMNVILGAAFVVAMLSFLNAVYGGLSDGTVPIIYTEVPFFATLLSGLSGPIGLIYAGTIMVYGVYTYIFCIAIASLFEMVYEMHGKKFIPNALRRRLKNVDAKIDQNAVNASDRFFIYNQNIGIGISLALILIYALLYIYLLILK